MRLIPLRFSGSAAFERVEEIEIRNFRIYDDYALPGQPHHQVRPVFARLRLLGKITVRAHPGGFHHAPECFFAPPPARLVRMQDHPELLRFLRQRLALLREHFQLFFYFAERGGLRRLALLQSLSVSLPSCCLSGSTSVLMASCRWAQIAFRRFLEFPKRLAWPVAKIPARFVSARPRSTL